MYGWNTVGIWKRLAKVKGFVCCFRVVGSWLVGVAICVTLNSLNKITLFRKPPCWKLIISGLVCWCVGCWLLGNCIWYFHWSYYLKTINGVVLLWCLFLLLVVWGFRIDFTDVITPILKEVQIELIEHTKSCPELEIKSVMIHSPLSRGYVMLLLSVLQLIMDNLLLYHLD